MFLAIMNHNYILGEGYSGRGGGGGGGQTYCKVGSSMVVRFTRLYFIMYS